MASINLDETTKTLLFSIILAAIFILSLIAFIGYIMVLVTRKMGKELDQHVYNTVSLGVINNSKHFKKYCIKKNYRIFYKESRIPLLIVALGSLVLLIKNAVTKQWDNPFSTTNGFGTLFFTWDFKSDPTYKQFLFIGFPKWAVTNKPHLVGEAWATYIFGPCLIIGGFWYLLCVQGYLARAIRLRTTAKSVFAKDLDTLSVQQKTPLNQNVKLVEPQDKPDDDGGFKF